MKKKRVPPRSRRNRRLPLPIISLDEQLEYAEKEILCSGICDGRPLGGPKVLYFTIMKLEDGIHATVRGESIKQLMVHVKAMEEVIVEVQLLDKAPEQGEGDLRNN